MKVNGRKRIAFGAACLVLIIVAACVPSPAAGPTAKPVIHGQTQEAVLTEKINSPTAGIPSMSSTPTLAPIPDSPLLPT